MGGRADGGQTVGGVGRARMGQGRSREVGRRGIVRAVVREGRGRGRFWGAAGGWAPHGGRRRLQPHAQGAARTQGQGGWAARGLGAGRSWATELAQGGGGEASWAARGGAG
jgi:hypothetical protein